MFLTLKTCLMIALLLSASAISTSRAGDRCNAVLCFVDWAAAAAVVKRENLVTVEALGSQFRHQRPGVIVKTQLCQKDGEYTYRLVIRQPNGRFKSAIYDAKRGNKVGFTANN